jgi:transposase-like protein
METLLPMDDWALEDAIDAALGKVYRAKTDEERRAAWEHVRALIAQRSPQRVAQMERERGLA